MGLAELLTCWDSPACLLTVAAAILAMYLLYSTLYAPYQVLRRSGITKGPPAVPFFGSYREVAKMGFIKFYEQLYEKYGSVVGFYIGRRPIVMVADLDMVKQITVVEFGHFMDREVFKPQVDQELIYVTKEPFAQEARASKLIELKGKSLDKIPEGTLTNVLYPQDEDVQMLPLIKKSCDTLVEKLGECIDSDKSVEVFRVYGQFTMETILATAFGRVIDVQRGEGDQLTKAVNNLFSGSRRGGTFTAARITLILSNFPWMLRFLQFMGRRSKVAEAQRVLERAAGELVRLRREAKEPSKYKDLLQLMIDATVDSDSGEGENDSKPKGRLSDEAIVAHSAVFFAAGNDTTANTLAYTSYLLALHPETQERLRTEIEDYFQNHPDKPMYEAIQELQYLDMVVQESLRLYPPATRLTRNCLKTTDINGVTIPKGAVVHIPIHLFHHLPEYWPNPDKFDPERFTPEEKAKRPPLAHMPFGWGHRNCIGMRFALMEAKLALIEILRKYKFVQAPDTEVPLKTVEGITMSPKNGIYLRIVSV